MTTGIINRLSADYSSLSGIPNVQTICTMFDRALEAGETGLGAADVFQRSDELGISLAGFNLAINALRDSRALDFTIRLPKELYPTAPAVVGKQADQLLVDVARLRADGSKLSELLLARYEVRPVDGSAIEPGPSKYETRIESNGSAWAGERWPDSVQDLAAVMAQHMLDPSMNRVEDAGFGWFHFSGNFLRQSHVFNISSNDPKVVVLLLAAMHANRSRPDYVAECDLRDGAAREYLALLQATGNREAYLEARRENSATKPPRAGEFVISQAALATRRPRP